MSVRDLAPVLAFALALACLPFVVASNAVLNFFVFVLIVALAAQGWNILGGFGGQYTYAHPPLCGTGAYATAILQSRFGINPWLAYALAVAVAALVGAVIGYLSFRSGLRGSYFALVTLAFAEVLRILANASAATGGAAGLLLKLDARAENFQFASRAAYFWLALALVTAGLVLSLWIARSRFGAHLAAVRENEDAAKALGVDALAVKIGAITLSAAVTGAAGGFYVQYFLYIDASIAYGTWISVEALLAPIIGGLGTVFGPLIGALALHSLGEATKLLAGRVPGIDLVAFGLVLIAAVAFAPDGLLGRAAHWRRRLAGLVRSSGRAEASP